jgi:hypothetical protein
MCIREAKERREGKAGIDPQDLRLGKRERVRKKRRSTGLQDRIYERARRNT